MQRAGRTILLTTHYMEEAERLCDRVAIMDHGKVIALGTPRELIASIGAGHVVRLSSSGSPLDAAALGALACVAAARTDDGAVEAQVEQLHDAAGGAAYRAEGAFGHPGGRLHGIHGTAAAR